MKKQRMDMNCEAITNTNKNKQKVSNLQAEFTAYLQRKDLAESSITHYQSYAELFLKWVKKEAEQVTKADILKHLEYLKKRKRQQNITRRNHLLAINHYFTFLYEQEEVTENPCLLLKIRGTQKKSLYKIFTAEQLEQLYDSYYQLYVRNYDDSHMPKNQRKQSALSKERNAAILSLLLNQGTTTKELDTLLIQDLDLIKATVKIRGGKKSNERILPLKAEQIGLLMHYTQNLRPQLAEYSTIESNKLFLPLPEFSRQTTDKDNLMHVFKPLTKQLKSIEPNFLNFKQTRASVITLWLKTVGLRKTQYLAGHRYISSTERYLPNNLEGLTNDIAKLHPY